MYSNNNSISNSYNNEILFWKIFRNIYIRNLIFIKLNSSNNNNINNKSYNSVALLYFLLSNNKLDIIIDKLKSNHYLYFNSLEDFYDSLNRIKFQDPEVKIKLDKIYQLLWLNYSDYIKDFYSSSKNIEFYKLWFRGISSGGIGEGNGNIGSKDSSFNNYMAHQLLYKYLKDGNLETVKYFKDIIKSKDENQQNYYNNHNNQNGQQEFINQLLSESFGSEEEKSIGDEIKDAIYNEKEIPIGFNNFYSNVDKIMCYINQDLIGNGNLVEMDFKSVLLRNKRFRLFNCGNNKAILELVYLTLLYRDSIIPLYNYSKSLNHQMESFEYYQLDNVLHAKIYVLNNVNLFSSQFNHNSHSKFKQYLKDNKVETLEQLISIANELLGEEGNLYKYLGDFYSYFYLVSKYSGDQKFQNNNLPAPNINHYNKTLLINFSVINQSTQVFKDIFSSKDIEWDLKFKIRQFNSVGFGFGSGNSGDELVKEISKEYFNYLIETVNSLSESNVSEKWISIFKSIIYNYNPKLFDWLLDSNQELRDIFCELVRNGDSCYKLLSAHTRIIEESNQINNEMFDIFIKYIYIAGVKEDSTNFTSLKNYKLYSHQIYILILNHLLNLKSEIINDNSNNHSFFRALIKRIVIEGLSSGSNVDRIIQSYNQINQELLSNYFKITSDSSDDEEENEFYKVKAYNNKSSILVPILIQSIVYLDYESINKIISATLNNSNNNIINNSNSYTTPIITTKIDNSLDLIKYLISNGYLKEFNLHYIIIEFINNIKVDKQFIIELAQELGNNNNFESLRQIINQKYNIFESDQKLKEEKRRNEEDCENFKREVLKFNTDYIDNNRRYFATRIVNDYIGRGLYSEIYNFLDKNRDIVIESGLISVNKLSTTFSNYPISVECFSKLYSVFFKYLIKSHDTINQLSKFNPEIFEFIWSNHFKSDKERIDYIMGSSYFFRDSTYFQLVEYIYKSKREFITSYVTKFDQNQMFTFHSHSLELSNISIFKQVRLLFPSFNFKINFSTIKSLIICNRYNAIEYLYENHLIENLEQIIGKENLNRLIIKEYNKKRITYSKNHILVSKSMFILIHTIIKLQQSK